MTTVINNPGESRDSGVGMIVGAIVLIVVLALFFIFGLPMIREANKSDDTVNVNVQLPPTSSNTITQ
jgi:hypothetical protein